MINVAASSHIKPESVEEYLLITKELVEKTNQEDGCIKYQLCQNLNDPNHFIMVEEWRDQDALDAHMKTEHFVELVPKMNVLHSEPVGLTIMKRVF